MHLHNYTNIPDQRHRVLDVGGDALLVDGEGVEVEDDGLEAAHLALRDVGMADVLLGSSVVNPLSFELLDPNPDPGGQK